VWNLVDLFSKMKKVYPEWKILLWRMGRSFMATFLATCSTVLVLVDKEMLQEQGIATIVNTILISGMVAGIASMLNGLGKYLRDEFGDEANKDKIHRLPF
jgi:hypothetical protein